MTSIHLRYTTLKRVLDIYNPETERNYDNILLIKKKSVSYISDVLTFIPIDICKIINAYYHKEICLSVLSRFGSLVIQGKSNFYLSIWFNDYGKCYPGYFKSDSVKINEDNSDRLLFNIMNEFMYKLYNKHEYINNAPKNIEVLVKNNLFVAVDDNPLRVMIMRILNYKKFTYDIAIIKCVIRGINKYFYQQNSLLSNTIYQKN